jgi:hypothetical protein
MKQYRRAPSHPLPTVQQVEDALDVLINAFVAHERKQPLKDGHKWPKWVLLRYSESEYLPHEEYLDDPIGCSLYGGIERLAEILYALTDDVALGNSLSRLIDRGKTDEGREIVEHLGGRLP